MNNRDCASLDTMVQVVFLVVKLLGLIAWAWVILVLSPVWLSLLVLAVLVLIVACST